HLRQFGVLGGGEGNSIISALDSLYDRAGIQLFVVYVDSFTGSSDWANDTAILNRLGSNDVLLAVAVGDRNYELSTDADFSLSDAQLSTVERAIEAELRNDNWAQAAIVGAQALEAEAVGVVGPGPTTPDPGSSSGGGIPILPIAGGIAVVGAGVFIFSRIRRRKSNGAVTAAPDRMSQKQLDQRAGSLLVQLDDSLKTSEDELGFAVAQFGEAATTDFSAVLASAKAKVRDAFAVKQKLDDANPDSDADKRAWTTQIIQLCEAADEELDSQADAFDALRELEKDAPAALKKVVADAATTRAGSTRAAAALAALTQRFATSAIAPVADNIAQAGKLLTFADSAAEKASAALGEGSASEAAIAVRTAQASVGQATRLYEAIDSLASDLGDAETKLAAVVQDTTQDIAAARSLPQDPSSVTLAPAIAAAEAALTAAHAAQGDPVTALTKLEQANSALDEVFVGVRDTQQQMAQARSQLEATIASARAQISSAAEYITTRRGGIGESARTRVSEADRRLDQAIALAATDPIAALAEAKAANQLGATAFDLARRDAESFTAQSNYRSMPRGSDGADLGGLLGGLIGGMVGSNRGGGWSSGSSGASSSGSYRSPSRTSRSGSFGGSSRSSGRSSGGRTSRGGRF
ncbi:MAG: TPM domain-containing protein, partial [Rhodoglobus sp.]